MWFLRLMHKCFNRILDPPPVENRCHTGKPVPHRGNRRHRARGGFQRRALDWIGLALRDDMTASTPRVRYAVWDGSNELFVGVG